MRARRAAITLLGATTFVTVALFASPMPASASTPLTTSTVTTVRACARPTAPHVMGCFALRRTDVKQPAALVAHPDAITPNVTPSGYGPTDLTSAYKLPSGGSGQPAPRQRLRMGRRDRAGHRDGLGDLPELPHSSGRGELGQ